MKSHSTNYIFLITVLLLLGLLQCLCKNIKEAKQQLFEYGFLSSLDATSEILRDSIKKFQKVNGLSPTGQFDNETIKIMASPRCGGSSKVYVASSESNKWLNSHITYQIVNWTRPFTKTNIINVFENSIMEWTNEVNFKVTESTSDTADIKVHFAEQDGAYNTLGYAYFPETGEIFFDKDEDWTLDACEADKKIFFNWVAIHELGHALGLPHDTESRQSIMYPYYSHEVGQPSKNDIRKMKRLYGEKVLDSTILCQEEAVDAILIIENMSILIKNKQYWTISDRSLQKGPYFLDLLFPGLPDQIDAAFSVKGTVYIFKDKHFYRFKKGNKQFTKKNITVGFEKVPNKIDAAFFVPSNGYIYFFKEALYYVFDTKKPVLKRLIIKEKDITEDWGVPGNVEAAALINESEVLFIKNFKCYIVNLHTKKMISEESCQTIFKC